MKSEKYWILGKVLPSIPEDYNESNGYDYIDDFNRKELKNLYLVGLDLKINHHQNLLSGKVTKQFDQPDGGVYIIAYVDTSQIHGKILKKLIESEKTHMVDLSLTHKTQITLEKTKWDPELKKTPLEVSVVSKARRFCDTCKIIYSIADVNASMLLLLDKYKSKI
jgi:hypothetical protein